MPPPVPPKEIAQLMRFIAEKTKNVKSPMSVKGFAAEFKEKTGSLISVAGLKQRIEKNRLKIHKMNGFDNDTKVKMMFAVSAPIDTGFFNKLRKQAEVEVDEKRRITKYQSKDGSLKLEGIHGQKYIHMSKHSDRWQKVCQKANGDESEEEGEEDLNGQNHRKNEQVNLVRFLIERTKNATFPLNLRKLAMDYKEKLKCSKLLDTIIARIKYFRKRISKMDEFDTAAKVKMLFALSASIDDRFLKELQKDAIVELDDNQKIKKYKANDGSLDLEGDHSRYTKIKATRTNKKKKISVVNDPSDSDESEEEKDSSETEGSDEESGEGNVGGSVKSNRASTSLSKKRSQRIRKSTVLSPSNSNKKRPATAQNQIGMSSGKKRTRISYSSSEASEDDEESMTLEDDPLMDSEVNNVDHGGDDFDYDPPANNHYEENLEHNVTDPISGRDIETPEITDDVEEEGKKEEEPSASSSAKTESMSLLELSTHLRSPIAKYTPNLVHKIDENIEKLKEKDKQIPFHRIIESLECCIQILNTPDEMDSDENTTSLPDFYYHLGMGVCNITHSTMDDFHVKMRKLATTGNEKVSMENIRHAMEKTLDKILN